MLLLTSHPLPPAHLVNSVNGLCLGHAVRFRRPVTLTAQSLMALGSAVAQVLDTVTLSRFERAEFLLDQRDLLRTVDQFADRYLRFPVELVARCLMRAPSILAAEQELPVGLKWSHRIQDSRSGLSLRLLQCYDTRDHVNRCSLDILYGVPEHPIP